MQNWITIDGFIYQGDCALGDRAATDAEVVAANTAATKVVPANVALWQAKAALQLAGKLDGANSAVLAMNNPVLTSFWNDANFIDRASPTLGQMAASLGMTSADIDNLFIKAESLKL